MLGATGSWTYTYAVLKGCVINYKIIFVQQGPGPMQF